MTEIIVKKLKKDVQDRRDKLKVEEMIKGLKFRALHLNHNRTFIITGLSKDSVGKTTFNKEENGEKKQITVYNYFKKQYPNFKIDQNLPCVQVGQRNNLKYFPIESCYLEHGKYSSFFHLSYLLFNN